jgi:hypothetical protein
MTRIIVDESLRKKLRNFSEPLELCEEGGHIVARLLPAFDPSAYEGLEPQISKEELQRRKQHKGKTYSTAEVLAHLEKL